MNSLTLRNYSVMGNHGFCVRPKREPSPSPSEQAGEASHPTGLVITR